MRLSLLLPSFRLRFVVLMAFLMGTAGVSFGAEGDERSAEQQAVVALRRVATNIQYHRDETVRLVRLSKQVVTDASLVHLQQFPRIEYLAVVCPQVTDAGLANIAGLSNLDTLLLSQSGVGSDGLANLRALSKLERLYLAETQISDDGLKHLRDLTSLRALSLDGTQITDAGLEHLSSLANLETLLLSDTAVSDAGLSHLQGLTKLKAIFLSRTKITGGGLTHLRGLANLKHLCLNETELSDEAIEPLSALGQVEVIELYGTRLTREGIAKLRAALPKTVIYVDPSIDVQKPGESSLFQITRDGPASEEAAPATLPPIRERLSSEVSSADIAPDFQRHVVPLLGRLGCNGRACHGSFQGQGGFRLSMFGYDFQVDYENLSKRINRQSPDESLILNKPTSEDEHGGGLRLVKGSWEQKLLRGWIASGAAADYEHAANFVRLEVSPSEIVLREAGQTAQLQAIAVWSDGTREDVTCLTRFQTNNETVAEVTRDGLIRATGRGDTHIVSFYDNGIVATPVLMPVSDRIGEEYPSVPTPTRIDELVVAKLSKLGIVPSELCADEDFLRRVSLDMIGTLPAPADIREFVADNSPDKRTKKIDQLLEHPAYITWWTMRLCDLTGSNSGYLGGTEMASVMAEQWRAWIQRRVQDNVGWDKIVEEIVLARSRRPGQPYQDFIAQQSTYTRDKQPDDATSLDRPLPHFWFRDNISQSPDKALAFGYIFMGVRLQCAQCHKHPFDQWSKQDFEQFTEFFTRVKVGLPPDAAVLHEEMRQMLGVPDKLNTAALRRQEYLRVAAEGRPIPWNEVYIAAPAKKSTPARLLAGPEIDLSQYDDPREPLMQWLRTEPNRYLAKAFVNRIWAHYFGVGVIDPPDDLNLANPPVNRELLDYLADEFIAHGYDMKWLHRTIANSRTYQLSWEPNETNVADDRNFSRAIVRRLPAEVFVDALDQATASDLKLAALAANPTGRKIGDHPRSYQARVIDYALLIFGKPLRTTNCDCERQNDPTLLQSLYVRNDQELLQRLDRRDGWLFQLSSLKPQEHPAIDDLVIGAYLRTLSRRPTEDELKDCRQHLADAENPLAGLRDLMWALLNTAEFVTNH
jgi:hypothetical protein